MSAEIPDRDFFKLPHAVVDSCLLARMKPSEVKVYLVIARYAHYKDRRAFPSVETICRLSGTNKNAVCKATERLEYYGLIKKYQAPKGFKFKNVYKIIMDPEINPNVIPHKVDKRGKRYRGSDGKFIAFPHNMEAYAHPQNVETHTIPQNTESKKNERELSRDSLIKNQNKISKETIKVLRQTKGDEWLQKYMEEQGYCLDLLEEDVQTDNRTSQCLLEDV